MGKPSLPQFDHKYDYYKMRAMVDELNRWIETVESGTSGAGSAEAPVLGAHNLLSGRSAADAHPISAITGLQVALNGKASVLSVSINTAAISALGVRVTNNEDDLDQARTQRYFFGE